jgi:DNA-binding NarL/FixJ family response regulator
MVSLLTTRIEDYPEIVKTKPILALIIGASSPLQDGLLALMTTSDQISIVFVAEEASLALRMVKDHHPNLVLLDTDLPEAQMVLEQIKNKFPKTRCIALLGSGQQEREVKEADAVLIEGFSPSQLLTTIEVLLAQSETR